MLRLRTSLLGLIACYAVLAVPGGVSGSSTLPRLDVPRDLKVVSYFPADAGWTEMWTDWQPDRIDADLARAASLNANTVRAIVEPDLFGYPHPTQKYTSRLGDFVSLAAVHGLHVQVTIFDWWYRWEDVAGSKTFYSAVFGWGAESYGPEGPGGYTEWKLAGHSVGGMMARPDTMPAHVPPHWMVYFAVADTHFVGNLSSGNQTHGVFFAAVRIIGFVLVVGSACRPSTPRGHVRSWAQTHSLRPSRQSCSMPIRRRPARRRVLTSRCTCRSPTTPTI